MSLLTEVLITHTLRCDVEGCDHVHVWETDDEDFEVFEDARHEGWQITDRVHLCPDCGEGMDDGMDDDELD